MKTMIDVGVEVQAESSGGVWHQGTVELVAEKRDKFYVHFHMLNRRSDMWLPASSIRLQATPVSVKGRKLLTGKKKPCDPPFPRASNQQRSGVFFDRPRNVHRVVIGACELDTWYFSPFPFARLSVRRAESTVCLIRSNTELSIRDSPLSSSAVLSQCPYMFSLHICPYCTSPHWNAAHVARHLVCCSRRPPGEEVYRDAERGVVVFEVEGKLQPSFCRNLCLLSKLFMESKALDYDSSPFVFYVLCLIQSQGCEVAGYFSREKESPFYNLSCIMTLPQYQGKGIGRFLVELSYGLSRRMCVSGSPEEPVSDLGMCVYRAVWREMVVGSLLNHLEAGKAPSIVSIVSETGISGKDIESTMKELQISDCSAPLLHVTDTLKREHELRQRKKRSNRSHCVFDHHLLSWDLEDYDTIFQSNAESPIVASKFLPFYIVGKKHSRE